MKLIRLLPVLFALLPFTLADVLDPGSGAPDPTDAQVRLWLDASDPSTLWADVAGTIAATNGGLVARWDDKSLSAGVVSQANSTNMPVFTNAVPSLDNAAALFFVGGPATGDALLSTNGNFTGLSGNTNFTVVTVWRNTGFTGVNYQHTFHMGNSAGSQAYGHSTARAGGLGTRMGNHYWGSGFDTLTVANTNANYAVSSYDGSTDHWYVNGRLVGTNSVPLTLGTGQLAVGSRINPVLEGFIGYLAEVIVFAKVLDTEERVLLAGYIENKYGIASFFTPDPEGLIDLATGEPQAAHPDLRLWLDADDDTTLWQDVAGTIPATNGSVVARWDDKSLSSIVVTQSSSNNTPVYAEVITNMNDRAAVQFVGGPNGDALTSTTGNSTGISARDAFTLITVWQNTGFTGQNYQHSFHFGNTAARQAYGHSTSRNTNEGSPIGNHYWNAGFDVTNVTAAAMVPRIALSEMVGALDTWYVNGTLAGQNIVDVLLGLTQLQVGSRLTPFTEGFTGDLCEVMLIARALTEAERNALGFYLQEKYGIPVDGAAVQQLRPVIQELVYRDPGVAEIVLTWSSDTNTSYFIDAADVAGGGWSTIVSNIVGAANSTTFTNVIMDPNTLRKVFRVGEE